MREPFFLFQDLGTLLLVEQDIKELDNIGMCAAVQCLNFLIFFDLRQTFIGLLHDFEGKALACLFMLGIVDDGIGAFSLLAINFIILHITFIK